MAATCGVCGTSFTRATRAQRICDQPSCRQAVVEAAAVKRHERYEAFKANQRQRRREQRALMVRSTASCAECGERFVLSRQRRFCSADCGRRWNKRVDKRVRRARLRAVAVERVDPVSVFNRDRWRCQLCGQRTPRSLQGSMADNAPELDHIIPLSLGGSHSYDNTQCACRSCNGKKGASTRGQLRLDMAGGPIDVVQPRGVRPPGCSEKLGCIQSAGGVR